MAGLFLQLDSVTFPCGILAPGETMTINLISATVILGSAILATIASGDRTKELEVVASVDLSRYTGRWYEIARLPNRFQKKQVFE
jgi:lipocalin